MIEEIVFPDVEKVTERRYQILLRFPNLGLTRGLTEKQREGWRWGDCQEIVIHSHHGHLDHKQRLGRAGKSELRKKQQNQGDVRLPIQSLHYTWQL